MELEEGVFAAEKIVRQRLKKGKKEYLVKWIGCTTEENTWEPAKNIYDKRLIAAFEQTQQKSSTVQQKKRGRKPKQVVQQQQHHERQVVPFRGNHGHKDRDVSSTSSSSSCSSEEAGNNDSTRGNRSASESGSSDNTSSSSSSDDDENEEAEQDSETEKKIKKDKIKPKPKEDDKAKKITRSPPTMTLVGTTNSSNSPTKEKSPMRDSLKRKAEVIQESGKIGVTITTTPKTSPTAPLLPAGSFGYDNGTSNNIMEAASQLLKQHASSHSTPTSANNAQQPAAKVSRSLSNVSTGTGGSNSTTSAKSTRPARAVTSNGSNHNNNNSNKNFHSNLMLEQDSNNDALPAEYWMTKQPLANQIVLTDVTVNDQCITVRECKSKDEFFKSPEEQQNDGLNK